jgi:anti-anti-sigma factor
MNTVVVVFSGEYDLEFKEQFRAELTQLAGVPNVILDCSDVTYLDSTILTELIRLHRLRAENRYERETIVLSRKHLVKLFDLLDLKKVFRLVDRVDDAFGDDGERERAEIRHAFHGRVSPDLLWNDDGEQSG